MRTDTLYPFTAIVGQEQAKKALLLALVNRKAGGLLIGGVKGTAKSVLARSMQELVPKMDMLTLPLNVTEDMLFGSIDIEYAVSRGEKRFSPGLLARATDNLLYIDEANLLRPELLTAVLDANSAGVNNVERDGISYSHAVSTTIIATMNPEEGTLPAHILDRFGMYVDVQALTETGERVEVMRCALAYSRNIAVFRQGYAEATKALAAEVAAARELLSQVQASDAMLLLAAQMCAQAYCAGHRAELYLLEAARAAAALVGRRYVLPQDMEEAGQFVLPHRMRKPPEQQPNEQEQAERTEENNEQGDEEQADDNDANDSENEQQPLPPLANGNEDSNSTSENNNDGDVDSDEDEQQQEQNSNKLAPEEQLADIDKSFRLPKMLLDLGKDRNVRRGSGKRSVTKTDLKQGRYVRAEMPKGKATDLAFDATIRAAAPYQRLREANGCALNIKEEDLRQKVREKRIGNTFLFAVDASGSMGARERMRAVKGAIFYMLQEAYQKRDRVGMIAFRRNSAEVLLPITRSVDLAQKRLAEMPTGGKTPLADGLALSLQTLALLNKRDSELEPILILVTDGRANSVHEGEKDPVAAAISIAEKIAKAKITTVVIDTESDFIKLGLAKKLAAAMRANYYTLQRLSKENIIHIVRNLN